MFPKIEIKNSRSITCDHSDFIILSRFGGKRADALKVMINQFKETSYIIFEISCNVNGKKFIGIMGNWKFYNESTYSIITYVGGGISFDLNKYSPVEFSKKIVGAFTSEKEALDYRDYYLNKCLDRGEVLYNEEVYFGAVPRLVIFPLPMALHQKLLEYCFSKKMKLPFFISKIIVRMIERLPRFKRFQ